MTIKHVYRPIRKTLIRKTAFLKNIFSHIIDAHRRIDGKNLIDAPSKTSILKVEIEKSR